MAESLSLDELRERATITVAEAAQLLGCKPDTVYAYASELPWLRRIGRRWIVAVPALLAWLGADEAADREADDEPPLRVIDGAGGRS